MFLLFRCSLFRFPLYLNGPSLFNHLSISTLFVSTSNHNRLIICLCIWPQIKGEQDFFLNSERHSNYLPKSSSSAVVHVRSAVFELILVRADIIFLPYNYLVDPRIRKTLSVDLMESVVSCKQKGHSLMTSFKIDSSFVPLNRPLSEVFFLVAWCHADCSLLPHIVEHLIFS